MKEITADMNHSLWPIGPVGQPTEFHLAYPIMIMKYTKYPKACKSFIAFMMEADQYGPWLESAVAYLTHPLNAYDSNPVWTSDPKLSVARDAAKRTLTAGGLGSVGEKGGLGAGRLRRARHVRVGVHRPGLDQGCDLGGRAPGQAHLPLSRHRGAQGPPARLGQLRRLPLPPDPERPGHVVSTEHQPRLPRLAVHASSSGFPAAVPGLPAWPGHWLSFTDAKIGRPGEFVGLENYEWIVGDPARPGLDYVALVDPGTFTAGPEPGPALLVAAARAGRTRLIDNMALVLPAEGAGDAAHH